LREIIFNEGLQKIGFRAFFVCTSLECITIPSTVVDIGDHAFSGCSNLREVTLNGGLHKIGVQAFYSCTSLENIKLPSTVTDIGCNAFYDCWYLREVLLNDGLKKIGNWAFYNCRSLKSIKLPTTVTEIGNGALGKCKKMREVELNGIPRYLNNEAFRNSDSLERFLFPAISYHLKNILQTSHWEELEDKVNEVRGVVQWESDKLFVSTATYHTNWNETKRDLGRIIRLISYYELKEVTTTFELALWKFNLDQADASNTTNRGAYQIDVPGPVKDTMLQYLDHI
jgi:hypothetical protein